MSFARECCGDPESDSWTTGSGGHCRLVSNWKVLPFESAVGSAGWL